MKKNIFAAVVSALVLFASLNTAQAAERAPDFSWVGASSEFQSRANSVGVEAGSGWVINDASVIFAAGGQVNAISKNGKTILIPCGFGMISGGKDGDPLLFFKSGYTPKTGAVAGVDVAFPVFSNQRVAIKIGALAFQNQVDGGWVMMQLGVVHSF